MCLLGLTDLTLTKLRVEGAVVTFVLQIIQHLLAAVLNSTLKFFKVLRYMAHFFLMEVQ